jgi:hypothetical protein
MNHCIEILFFAGCPRWGIALDRANEAVAALGLSGWVEVRERQVETEDEAVRIRFLGSPTVLVDGRDVELGATQGDDFGLRCRLYQVNRRPDAAPSVEWIKTALLGADR